MDSTGGLNVWDDLALIWEKDCGQYPQGDVARGWFGFWFRIKCTVCILLGWEGRDPYVFSCIPVGISYLEVSQTWDGPTANWTEIGVDERWSCWLFYRYRNGI